ncbi:hypothetical protein W02_11680 [Nitrospira sp. KM1]|uniref:hypothetical protein n=1 Tax=Nitrospira sp. KM1 TaxID=1936990 RepID=UPI0013A7874A|nr:hypothetical protein [Nitrospira sp. KM1]BCA54028.1 hypothetical protein W02_11680 [Nitrospira sp. KM1]
MFRRFSQAEFGAGRRKDPVYLILPAAAMVAMSSMAVCHHAAAADSAAVDVKEQREALMKNVEEMVAHGGMGDAKAIVHHCQEASRYAATLKQAVEDAAGRASLDDVIRYCGRVEEIGVHADPGMLLNPALKAHAAARAAIKVPELREVRSTESNRSLPTVTP